MLNGQSKMVSNELQSSAAVAKSSAINPTNSNMAVTDSQVSSHGQNSNRTQDDAMVSYVFQRQNWFGPEDGNLIDVRYLNFIDFKNYFI